LTCFVLLSAFTNASALTAGFTASTISGCAPLLVSFTNTTTPMAGTTFSWTFGASSGTSTLTNPSVYFTDDGPQVVTLTATNGGVTSTYTMTITVHPQPTVNFTASDTTVCPNTPITFTSTTLGGVPGGVTCTWNWGDGGSATGSPATHSYSAPGNYTVSLYATNSMGCQNSLVKPAHIHVSVPPHAAFVNSGGCNPPVAVTFTSTGTVSVLPATYAWTYGDGGTGAGTPSSHTYTSPGSYPVRLVVTDANGCIDSVTVPVTVATMSTTFTGPDSVCVYSTATFTNTSSPFISCLWSYGDGGTSTGATGAHAWSAPGTYIVTLTTYNHPCTTSVTKPIVVMPGPTVDFTINPIDPCPAPVSVTYTGSSSASGTTYNWLFGPPTGAATGNPVTYTYPTNGIKTVTMIAINPANGCRDTVVKKDTIYNLWYEADASPRCGCVPLTVGFFGSAWTSEPPAMGVHPYPKAIASYSWNFGDGSTPGTGATPSHTYTAAGIYIATVTITTENGCTTTDTVRIEVGKPPVVTFSVPPTHICYGSHAGIVFTPHIVDGPVDHWHWIWGDGTENYIYDTTVPPHPVTHTFVHPGVFTVTLIPTWRCCEGDPYVSTVVIIVDSPMAVMEDTIYCSPRTRVKFWNYSWGDDTHLWIFGDGTTSTADDPVHDYPSVGTYTVALATYNAASGCRDTVTRVIVLAGPVPDFVASSTSICKGGSVTFTSTTTSPAEVSAYQWYADSWTPISGATNPTYTRLFSGVTDTGYHTIRLVIRNINGCYDTFTRANYIHVGGPAVDFTFTPSTGCVPLSVLFTDASTAVSTTSLVSHTWRFGDGGTGTGATTSHTYVTPGYYTIWHIVTDSRGCKDSANDHVTATKPVAAFTATPTSTCVGTPIPFTIISPSLGSVATAFWDFGDGTTSSSLSPVHTYTTPGWYTVSLVITDVNGCTDDTIRTSFIYISKPHAQFKMSDSISVCPPLLVNFTNLSSGAVSYSWDLGDGSTSVFVNPTNMYLSPGLYNVVLVVTDGLGCKDTAQRPVNIYGYAGAFTFTPDHGCVPQLVQFTASLSNVPYITWDFSDGVTSSVSFTDTISHWYTVPGMYVPKLILTDNTGCQSSSTGDTIFIDQIMPKFTSFPSPVCVGVPFHLIDSSTTLWDPVNSWEWTYDGNTSTTASPSHTFFGPGSYSVSLKVKNSWGCEASTTGSIVVEPPPVVTANSDTVVCVGDPATLYANGAITYTWEPPATLSCTTCNPTTATPATETTYTVTGTDARGCIDTAAVTVRLRTHTTSRAWGDTAVCLGVSVQLFDTGGTSYLWLPPTGLNSNTISNPVANPHETTLYTVIAQLGGCIPDTQQVLLTIWPLPSVDAGPNQRILAGSTANLQATGKNMAWWEWWPGETLSCTDCLNPVASMSMTTTYFIDVKSEHGCPARDSVTITLYCDNSMVFIPNAFTPNGDGQNDIFYPRGAGLKVIKTLRIYNRWGELLFSREGIQLNDESNGWDGSYKGNPAHTDVYVYIIEAICYTGDEVFIKGDVTILK